MQSFSFSLKNYQEGFVSKICVDCSSFKKESYHNFPAIASEKTQFYNRLFFKALH